MGQCYKSQKAEYFERRTFNIVRSHFVTDTKRLDATVEALSFISGQSNSQLLLDCKNTFISSTMRLQVHLLMLCPESDLLAK